jgi:hypothetical protein
MKKVGFILFLFILVGCDRSSPVATTAVAGVPFPTTGSLPATFTRPASSLPPPTQTPRPTFTPDVTATSIDFDKTAIELRFTLPAIGLNRSLRGNISGQITAVDETTGQSEQINNQANVLIELQDVFATITLEAVPEDCDTCVQLTYDLPLTGESGSGWLQDVTFLASMDNYLTAKLGPHFPPGTRLGLRRSISPYAPAHTLAILEDGRLWRWLATDFQLSEPAAEESAPNLLELVSELPEDELAVEYVVTCDGAPPVETLFLGPERPFIRIECPEFSLPSTLLTLYLALDELLAPTIAEVAVPRPPGALPLDALIDYRRADDTRLTLFQDGRVSAIDTSGTYTGTLSSSQIISITTSVLDSGLLRPGLTSFNPTATPVLTATAESKPAALSWLLLRGPQGVFDGRWPGIPDLPALNDLLDALLPAEVIEPIPSETAVTQTPESSSTSTPTPNP